MGPQSPGSFKGISDAKSMFATIPQQQQQQQQQQKKHFRSEPLFQSGECKAHAHEHFFL